MAAIELDLSWEGNLLFTGSAGEIPVILDGEKQSGISPVQALTSGLAGCMAIDVVHILERMRTRPEAMQVRLRAERAVDHPKRLVSIALHFELAGDIPRKNVERAINLSRSTYCSVWHSLRQDIELEVDFVVRPAHNED
jgi:putative redox protein